MGSGGTWLCECGRLTSRTPSLADSTRVDLAPKQIWYILPMAWLRELRDRVAQGADAADLGAPDCWSLIDEVLYEPHRSSSNATGASPPASLPASPSVGPNGEGLFYGSEPAAGEMHLGGWRMRNGLVEGDNDDADIVFVTDAAWRKITAWHGPASPAGGLARRTQSDVQGNVVIEVNPPTFLVHVVGAASTGISAGVPLRVTASKFENLSDLHRDVRHAVLGGRSAPSRLWKLEMPPALLVEAEAGTQVVVQGLADKVAGELNGSAVVRGLPGSMGGDQPAVPQPMDISQEELPSYEAPPGYTGPIASSVDAQHPLPARAVLARRMPSLSATLLMTLGTGSRVANDPLVEEALLESGDCLALEFGQQHNTANVVWEVGVNEENRAQEKAVARAPLFSKPAMFSGSSSAVPTLGNSLTADSARNGIMTRSQAAGPSKGKTRGLKGLQNLGVSQTRDYRSFFAERLYLLQNTCFMNSALQCLSNTKELSEYFQCKYCPMADVAQR